MKFSLCALIIATLLSLTGCAGAVRSDFAGNNTYNNIKSAKLGSMPIGNVEYGDFINIKISTNSPSIESEPAKGRYEIISVHGKKGQPFSMIISAICDCLGFRKWTVVPFSYLIDESGNLISTGVFSAPHIQSLTGFFPEDSEYYVMVVADRTSEGKKIRDISGGLFIPGSIYIPGILSVPATSHPTGIVQVKFNSTR